MKKNKYKNSKHFWLVYNPLKRVCLNCDRDYDKLVLNYSIPIKYFDSLLEIIRYLKYKCFYKLCSDANIYCIDQLKVLIGVDSKLLKYSVNRYRIEDIDKPLSIKHGYYFYMEQVIYLEEFIDEETLKVIESNIKSYSLRAIYKDIIR